MPAPEILDPVRHALEMKIKRLILPPLVVLVALALYARLRTQPAGNRASRPRSVGRIISPTIPPSCGGEWIWSPINPDGRPVQANYLPEDTLGEIRPYGGSTSGTRSPLL